MGFLKDIFKRKPGGTMVGNLIRGAAKTAVNTFVPGAGALIGNGAMMITQEQADLRDLSDHDYMAKYGVAKDGTVPRPTVVPALAQTAGALFAGGLPAVAALPNGPLTGQTNNFQQNAIEGANKGVSGIFAKYGGYFVAAFMVLVGALVLIFKKK